MKKVDYIIIGQGLAGSVLAFTLIQQGQKVLVVDADNEDSSSKVAAGLCNPMVFKRLTKSWMVDEVLTYAKDFYRYQEQLLHAPFYFELPLYKLFADEKEQAFWKQKSNEPHLFDWMHHQIEFPFDNDKIHYPFGAAKVLQSGYLNTSHWLNSFKKYLIEKESYLKAQVDYAQIKLNDQEAQWNGYIAKKIIFCEGYRGSYNPYFKDLPFKLTKGEVLTIQFNNLELKQAINKGAFLLPYQENYKLGATYNWDDLDSQPTIQGKENLLKKAAQFIHDDVEVLEHKAGVRPTVSDRRPLLGVHPEYPQLAIFNGMGTKGVMLAPYFADKMVRYLLKNEPLPDEVNITRFNN